MDTMFTSFDRNGRINPTWYKVIINFETKNQFELLGIRKMLEGENGAIDFNNFFKRPNDEDMVEWISDSDYEHLAPAEKAAYDKAVEENRIGTGWETDNWGCAINAVDAEWVGTSTLRFEVTNGIPEQILEAISKNGKIPFNGMAVPNKFFKPTKLFGAMRGKVEYRTPDNVPKLVCEIWDIPEEEMEGLGKSFPTLKKKMVRIKGTNKVVEDRPWNPPKVEEPAELVQGEEPAEASPWLSMPSYEDGLLPKGLELLEKLFGK